MSDDLVKRLRNAAMKRDGFDAVYLSNTAADRIEELEAKLEEVVKVLEAIVDQNGYADDPWGIAIATLAALKGDT